MNIDFLKNEENLTRIFNKDALQVKEMLKALEYLGPNDLVEKLLLCIALQTASMPFPQLSVDNASQFKNIMDIKKVGIAAASKIHRTDFTPTDDSIPTLKDLDLE